MFLLHDGFLKLAGHTLCSGYGPVLVRSVRMDTQYHIRVPVRKSHAFLNLLLQVLGSVGVTVAPSKVSEGYLCYGSLLATSSCTRISGFQELAER